MDDASMDFLSSANNAGSQYSSGSSFTWTKFSGGVVISEHGVVGQYPSGGPDKARFSPISIAEL